MLPYILLHIQGESLTFFPALDILIRMAKISLPEKPLEKQDLIRPYRTGDIVEGTVIGTGRSSLFLNLGPQGTGIIYGKEFLNEKGSLKSMTQGKKVRAKIIDMENDEGYIELSFRDAGRELVWEDLKQKKDREDKLTVKILSANKGGLLAELEGIPAFIPVSQLSSENYPRVEDGDAAKIYRALQKFVGQELQVQIIDLDPKEGKIILSEKAKEREKVREMLSQYHIGDEVEGEITGVVEFGAFMRFGKAPYQMEGLIHISEIDWQIIEDPSAVLKVGETLKAKIIDIANAKVSLSLKALKEDPWKNISQKYAKGNVIQGKATKLNPFGAFVEIEPKIQGLSHITEFGTRERMESQIRLGETYSFQILEINPQEHRMSLRLANQSAAALTPESQDSTAQPAKAQ